MQMYTILIDIIYFFAKNFKINKYKIRNKLIFKDL